MNSKMDTMDTHNLSLSLSLSYSSDSVAMHYAAFVSICFVHIMYLCSVCNGFGIHMVNGQMQSATRTHTHVCIHKEGEFAVTQH